MTDVITRVIEPPIATFASLESLNYNLYGTDFRKCADIIDFSNCINTNIITSRNTKIFDYVANKGVRTQGRGFVIVQYGEMFCNYIALENVDDQTRKDLGDVFSPSNLQAYQTYDLENEYVVVILYPINPNTEPSHFYVGRVMQKYA